MAKRSRRSEPEPRPAPADRPSSPDGSDDWKLRYEAAVRAGRLIIYDWDLARGTLTWGGESEAILGYRPDEMGDPAWAFEQIHTEDRPRVREEAARIAETGTPSLVEYRVRHRDGGYLSIEDSAVALPNPAGGPARLVGFINDITARKQAEEQLLRLNETLERRVAERTRQIRQLATDLNRVEKRERHRLAGVLHDHVQQLLVAARLRLDLIQEDLPTGPAQEQVTALQELLDGVASACRTLTAELSPPTLYDEGLAAAIGWLAEWMRDKHGLTVTADAAPEAEPPDPAVRILLFEIVREALFNVVKHARTDRAAVRTRRAGADEIEIRVSDEGVGFDPSAVASAKGAIGGFGIPSIRHRLELLGGSVVIESEPDKGTHLHVRCPMDPSQESPETPDTPERPPLAGPHVTGRGQSGPRTTRHDTP